MKAARIVMSLETLDLTGKDADQAARLGFLEWAFAMPGEVTRDQIALALEMPEVRNAESAAAQAFAACLQQACHGITRPQRRTGRARRVH